MPATSDRKPHETATVLNQSFLDEAHDNLNNQLELIVDIDTPTGTIHASDRNKYVGSTFYEALLNFPVIKRTIGEFLSSNIQFSTLTLELSNVDGRFNEFLPSGANFESWVGKRVSVKLGLRDVASTFTEIFSGFITDEGGLSRSTKSITIVARDKFDSVNKTFPSAIFDAVTYPNIESSVENKIIPVIYGDWTVAVDQDLASVPAFVVNGDDVNVNGQTSNSLPISCVISQNDNTFFDVNNVYLFRGSEFFKIDATDIVNITNNKSFGILQSGTTPAGTTQVNGQPYSFKTGDKFFCRVKGKDLGAYDDNIVEIAKDILKTYGGLVDSDFDSTWATFRDKAAPAESAIANIKARAWIQEQSNAMSYAASLLEQVRLEPFVNRDLKFSISSLHLDEFVANPSFNVRNTDVEINTFRPRIDDKNNFNRAKAVFNFLPNRNENFNETPIFRNNAAISQVGKEISKQIVFPNLYVESDVKNQLIEILKLTSGFIEIIELTLTWRSLLLDIGDFVKLNINIQGTQFKDVPALIRDISYDPNGVKVPMKLWSLQMIPFSGYNPAYAGITGGSTANIVQE